MCRIVANIVDNFACDVHKIAILIPTASIHAECFFFCIFQYLLAPLNSAMYVAMCNSRPPDEIYNPIIVTDGRTVEEGQPLEAIGRSCSKQTDSTEIEA